LTKPIKILISGGGTGGHIFPALAIANAIRKIEPDATFLFVGAKGKMEMEKVPAAGYEIVGLQIAGIQRSLTFINLLKNLIFPVKLFMSLAKAFVVVFNYKPDIAIGTGGYASGPVLKICGWLGIPYIIQEQNSLPGITNKILGIHANAVCVAFDNMEKYFRKEKIQVTGNPIRENLSTNVITQQEGKSFFGLDANKPTVFITGGSLGARAINEGIAEKIDLLQKNNIQSIWQCGKTYLGEYKKYESETVKVMDFISNMDMAYAAADIIVSRAGGTISELAVVGKPTILLPSPNVAEDHQTKNVEALVQSHATILVKDAHAKSELVDTIVNLMVDEKQKCTLSENIKRMAKPNAAMDIARLVINIVKNKN
jgi:UDP-N-acetylglucosamine--N-acetylmuramyl-(pentapeptide) pyrophosphoryl-undecaprenol N-acetylglucosamine transferase